MKFAVEFSITRDGNNSLIRAQEPTTPMVNADARILKQLKNLDGLSSSQLDGLARNLAVKTFKKDEIVFAQDEQAKFVYLLISGVVRVSYHGYERQTVVSL